MVKLSVVGVADYDQAEKAAVELVNKGITAIELCAGFGSEGVARIIKAVGDKAVVGVVRFDLHPAFNFQSGDRYLSSIGNSATITPLYYPLITILRIYAVLHHNMYNNSCALNIYEYLYWKLWIIIKICIHKIYQNIILNIMASDLNTVETTLLVGGNKTHFVSLFLRQAFNSHHHFVIEVDYEELDENWMESPAKLIGLIGEPVHITMKQKQTGEENLFEGIIVNVTMSGYHGQQNSVVITGKSPTIKLDGKETMDSFMDKTLQQIVDEAVANSGNGGSVVSKPVFSGKLDYICQNCESCFMFINRLSWLYGEYFFYDGRKNYFGKPDGGKITDIIYDIDMTSFNLSANLMPPKFNRYYYLHHDDKEINYDAPGSVDGVEGYLQKSLAMSDKVYTSEAHLPLNPNVVTKKELEDMVKVEKTRAVADMLVVNGTTQTCKIKLGEKIKIKFPDSMKLSKKEVDTFIITEVSHKIDQAGRYSNSFEGIMAGMKHIPMSPCPAPMAGPQLAWVKSNADDKKRGRVKVQFQWQKKNDKTTNWVRVKATDAGQSDVVSRNRGLVTIPEKGDIVMVGFEYGDPDRPFVMGSIFSEMVSAGGKENNKIKSYTTRVGSTVTFDDDEHTIEISTSKKNKIFIEEKKGAITITADTSITLNAGETIDLNTKRISFNGSESVSTHSPDINIGFHGDKYPNKTIDLAGEKFTVEASKKILEQAPDINIDGGKTVEVKTTKMKLSGSSKIDISSPKIDSN